MNLASRFQTLNGHSGPLISYHAVIGNPIPPFGLLATNSGGTRGYWAPEIRAGDSVSVAGDVYSYGATVWHLATGCRPLDGQRFDVDVAILGDVAIRELIVACCGYGPGEWPSMPEALRMLDGESWPDMKAQRDARRLGIAFAIAAGALCLCATAASRGKAS